jgi:transposase InsO family protein
LVYTFILTEVAKYTSQLVRKPLKVIQAIPSMSAPGNCYENAKAEAFFSSSKTECFPVRSCFESKAKPEVRFLSTSSSTTVTNVFTVR